jgi:hypothetical protein
MHIHPMTTRTADRRCESPARAAQLFQHRQPEARANIRLPHPRLRDLRRPRNRHRHVRTAGETYRTSATARGCLGRRARRRLCPKRHRRPDHCQSDQAEVFVAGARFDEDPEALRRARRGHRQVQYGSDDTKTHRKIKHILGQSYHDRVGRLLVSELFTVGAGGWSGFPSHKHDTDRLPSRRPGTTRPTTSASGPTTDRACRCCSARTTNRATPITS